MKLAFVFPGQGSQHIGMAKVFYDAMPEVRDMYKAASGVLGYDMAKLSFEGPEEELNRTERTQPCLLTASIAAYTALSSRGVKADILAGHSLGEYSALVAAEAISLPDAVKLTELRGRLMQDAVPLGAGMMAAVLGLGREAVDQACASITSSGSGYVAPSNYNCPGQIVIAGETAAVKEAMEKLKTLGARRVIPLAVSVPSHTKLMEGVSKALSEHLFLGNVKLSEPRVPVTSNADAIFLTTVDGIKAALVKQLSSPVLWEYCVAAMAHAGVDTFVEVGPKKVLSALIQRCDDRVRVLNVEDMASLEKTLSELKA